MNVNRENDSMKRRPPKRTPADWFEIVKAVGLALPDVEATTRYDGSPALKVGGCFMAGLATHRSVEPGTLVVRVDLEERAWLLEDAPDTYYVTDYYRHYPVVLARLSRLKRDALRDLLSVSRRLTLPKTRTRASKTDKAGEAADASPNHFLEAGFTRDRRPTRVGRPGPRAGRPHR